MPPTIAATSEKVLAEDALSRGDTPAALAHSQLAVTASPMDARAIGLLVESYLASGQTEAAFDAMRFGQALGWRDTAVQAYLFEQAMANADAPRAALHLDALLRTRPGDAAIHSAIDRVLALANGEAAMLERLAATPRWRSAVMGALDGLNPEALSRRAAVLEKAIASGDIGCGEARYFASFIRKSGIPFTVCPSAPD